MLQHREAIIRTQSKGVVRKRPELDPQQLELIAAAIGESYSTGAKITLVIFNEFVEEEIIGVVIGLDQQQGIVKLKTNEIENISIFKVMGIK